MTRQRFYKLLIVFFLIVSLVAASKPTSEEQYYRGVYDICVYYGLKAGHTRKFSELACIAYTAEWVKAKRYEKTSHGWEWPLKAPKETQ